MVQIKRVKNLVIYSLESSEMEWSNVWINDMLFMEML
jgi:hypothetical protein